MRRAFAAAFRIPSASPPAALTRPSDHSPATQARSSRPARPPSQAYQAGLAYQALQQTLVLPAPRRGRRRERHAPPTGREGERRDRLLLAHAGLAPVAHAAGERSVQARPLRVREGDRRILGWVQRLELALEDVLLERTAGHLARGTVLLQAQVGIAQRHVGNRR